MSPPGSVDPKFKLHVSFTEADIDFVDRLLAALDDLGRFEFSVTPGPQDNPADWVRTAGELIEAADTVIFVLSPAATEFQPMAYEAERANVLSKRMLPVICQPLRKAPVPAPLAGIKPVRMETEQMFSSNMWRLTRSLKEEDTWVRRHTELYAKARKWQAAGHDETLLLAGIEIVVAKAWTFERLASAPKPTDLHMEFIAASEAAQSKRAHGSNGLPVHARKRARRKEIPAEAATEPRFVVQEDHGEPLPMSEHDVTKVIAEITAASSVIDQGAPWEPPPVTEQEETEAADEPAEPEAPLEASPTMEQAETETAEEPAEAEAPDLAAADDVTNDAVEPPLPKAKELPKPKARRRRSGPKPKVAAKAKAAPSSIQQEAAELADAPAAAEAPDLAAADAVINEAVEPPLPKVVDPPKPQAGRRSSGSKPKVAAKKILVDLEKLAYVPASLKISKAPKGSTHPCPEAANGMSDAVGGPEGEALQQAAAHAASQPARPDAEGVPLADAGILKSSTKPKKTKSAHPVVIAQDELDGLLSSLLKEPDNDRS